MNNPVIIFVSCLFISFLSSLTILGVIKLMGKIFGCPITFTSKEENLKEKFYEEE